MTRGLAKIGSCKGPKVPEKAAGKSRKKQTSSNGQLLVKFMEMQKLLDSARGMPDKRLIREVTRKVWGNLVMNSNESALLGELIERFKTRSR